MTKLLLLLLLLLPGHGLFAAHDEILNCSVAELCIEDEQTAQDTRLYGAEEQLYANTPGINTVISPVNNLQSFSRQQVLHPGYADKPYIPPGFI